MSDIIQCSIKDVVDRLKAQGAKNYGLYAEAVSTIEALRGEVERLKDRDAINATCHFQAAEINKLETERDRLKAALEKIADGDVPRESVTIWRSDGIHSKHDKCEHMRVMYDDCGNCISDFARKALGGDAS